MCVVSMVMDSRSDDWFRRLHPVWTQPAAAAPAPWPWPPIPALPLVTQEEIEEFRRLLDRAREYDRQHNQPDCELEEKRQRLRQLAEELGVKIDFV